MKAMITIMLALGIVGTAAAYDLGNALPEKTDVYPDYVNPDVRQGGDTIFDATVIDAIPSRLLVTSCSTSTCAAPATTRSYTSTTVR